MFRQAVTAIAISTTIAAPLSPAWAGATVKTVAPQVSINRGQGYEVVTASAEVSTGDRVMVGPDGRGKIVYADGCVIDVYPGRVLAVPDKCYKPMTAGLEAPPPAAYHVPWVPILLAAGVIGVGACAVSGCFENNGHPQKPPKPRSP